MLKCFIDVRFELVPVGYLRPAHISEVNFRKVLKLFCADVPALTVGGLVGLSVQTTQRFDDRLGLRILEMAVDEARPFAGEVEIDESYFGARRVRGKRGGGADGKTPVIGLLKRGGKVFTEIVENCSKAAQMPIIKGQVLSAPHHSWERGTNENTNGLIRQYLPKGVSMTGLTQNECDAIADKLNNRPRKRHGYKTPNQCFIRH